MQYDVYLLEARTRRRICRGGQGEVGGCSVGTQPEVGVSAPGGKPQGWADHRLTDGYLERQRIITRASSRLRRYSLSRLIVVAGWKAEWEWNTSEVQEDGEDSGVGMVKLRDSEVESEVVAE